MRHAIVVADGETPDRSALDVAWPNWADGATIVVAADAGAIGARRLGLDVDLVVGDGDSLGDDGIAQLTRAGIEVRLAPMDKDESDTELALVACLERAADRISVVGAFGGPRLDHTLANVSLLAMPELRAVDVVLLDSRARLRLLQADGRPASLRLPGRIGDIVSLLPLADDVQGITTDGLAYSLRDEPLLLGHVRGLSNVRIASPATVTLHHGRLLVVESPATLSG